MVSPVQNSERILLVEGQDDKHLVGQLCKSDESPFSAERSGYEWIVTLIPQASTFLILDKGNSRQLLESIELEIRSSGRQALGILADADGNLQERWEEVKKAFPDGVQLPSSPEPDGTIIQENTDQPRIGIWLMPDNRSAGELEDFVLKMVPSGDAVWPLSRSYIDNIPEPDRKFAREKTDKAKLHAWLSARKEPGRMGAAVGAEDLELNGPLCQNFFCWLTSLFG